MSDLISRQAAIDAIRASTKKYTGFMEMEMYTDDDAVEAIINLPSVLPKTGRWEKMEARGRVYRCNQCGKFLDFDGVNVGRGDANYCPNCGASMVRGEEDE